MSSVVISLVVVSTFMHAAWNLLARRQRSETAFFMRMVLIIVVIGLVPAVASEIAANSITFKAWACLFGSGLCCALYFFGLGRAYQSSDFTIVYPVARALPVILVGLGDVLRGRPLSPIGWAGMFLVVGGCLLCPLRSFREIRWDRYFNRAAIFIILTALGTVGYELLGKVASESVTPGTGTAARYCYFFFATTWLFYWPAERFFSRAAQRVTEVGWRLPLLAGLFNFGAYWLVLRAYQLTPRAGYVVAFRQFSIVIGVVLAFAIYKEKGKLARLTGAFLITAGLVLIGTWGG